MLRVLGLALPGLDHRAGRAAAFPPEAGIRVRFDADPCLIGTPSEEPVKHTDTLIFHTSVQIHRIDGPLISGPSVLASAHLPWLAKGREGKAFPPNPAGGSRLARLRSVC